MKNLNNKVFILILVILSSGCLNKKKINNINNKKKTSWNYNIGIEGIECKLCAYKAVKRLEKIPDVANVKIICSPNFRECYANLEHNNIKANINIQVIINAIEYEGFEVKYISGNFIGMFDDKLDKFKLFDQNQDIKFMTCPSKFAEPEGTDKRSRNTNQNNFNLQANHKIIIEDAKLIFQKKLGEVWMTLN